MKRTLILTICAVSLAFMVSGCAAVASPVGVGLVYTNVEAPLTATSNVKGSKRGTAKCTNVLGISAFGDCSIAAAQKNGGISTISTVDSESFGILLLFSTYTTIVTGE